AVTARCPEGEKNARVVPRADGGGIDLQEPADVVGGVELVHSALSPWPRENRNTSGSRTAVKRREGIEGDRPVPCSAHCAPGDEFHGAVRCESRLLRSLISEPEVRFDRGPSGSRPAAPAGRRPSPA